MSFDTYFSTGFYLETSKVLMRAMKAEDVEVLDNRYEASIRNMINV